MTSHRARPAADVRKVTRQVVTAAQNQKPQRKLLGDRETYDSPADSQLPSPDPIPGVVRPGLTGAGQGSADSAAWSFLLLLS